MDLKDITLWFHELITFQYGPLEKTGISWKNGIKAVYNPQSYWTSMAAILAFSLIGQMTEVLAPDIYRAHWF
jgi:hypothetical protein